MLLFCKNVFVKNFYQKKIAKNFVKSKFTFTFTLVI